MANKKTKLEKGTPDRKRAVIIGGGIHGMTVALALAKTGAAVTVIEKKNNVLEGTSGATHNRAHMGYHYPRSVETAKECWRGLCFFQERFPEALTKPREAYYLIEKNSQTSALEFEKFCKKMRIPYEIIPTNDQSWNRDNIECGFRVPEPVFDLEILKKLLKRTAKEAGVQILLNTEVVGFKPVYPRYEIVTKNQDNSETHEADLVVNATYAHANNILKLMGLEEDMTRYELQKTEVVVVRHPRPLPALTVMDGEFISIMPLAGTKDKYLVYDVRHSVIKRQLGFILKHKEDGRSNFHKMVKRGKKYFPFMEKLEFVQSNYGFRPIPLDAVGASRKTRLIHHQKHPHLYTIFEGKFISAPMIAEELVKLMRKNKSI